MNIGTENNSDFIINNKSVNTNTSLPLFIPTYQHKLCEAFQQIILHSPTYFGTELGSFQVAYSVRQFKTKISRNFGGAVYCQLPDRWNQQYTNNKLAYKNFPFFQYELSFDSSIIAEAIITSFSAFGPRTQNTTHAETALTSHPSMICIEYHKCPQNRSLRRDLQGPSWSRRPTEARRPYAPSQTKCTQVVE